MGTRACPRNANEKETDEDLLDTKLHGHAPGRRDPLLRTAGPTQHEHPRLGTPGSPQAKRRKEINDW
eukprot:scaffold332_cov308-Pavlova_lutheri.AAC.3